MEQPTRNILVLGANGFIGQALMKDLNAKLNISVFFIGKKELDLSTRSASSSLSDYILTNDIHTVVVLAAIKRQDGDSIDVKLINDRISTCITESCQFLRKRIHIIYISSMAIFGELRNHVLINEASPYNPTSFYGEHKVISELLYLNLSTQHTITILRPPIVYCNNSHIGYQPIGFYISALKQKQVWLWGDGSEYREFLHIHDLIYTIVKFIMMEAEGLFNIVSGVSYQYSFVIEFIRSILDFNIIHKIRTNAKVDHFYDAKKIREFLGPMGVFINPIDAVKFKHFQFERDNHA
jgi:nucleoside-diphosphate-sugar epimerase